MKKIFLLLIPLLLLSCANDIPDDPYTLPYVDTTKYVSVDSVNFPTGTPALDVYACLSDIYGEGTFNIDASYVHTETAVLNGHTYSDTIKKNITSVTISKNRSAPTLKELNTFIVEFHTDNNESITLTYQWYFHCEDTWENTRLNGDILIKLIQKS